MIQPSKAPAVTGEWECTECGHIEEGTENRRPAQCPECDAPADALEFYAFDEEEDDDEWDEAEDEVEDEDLDADDDDEDIDDSFEDDDDLGDDEDEY